MIKGFSFKVKGIISILLISSLIGGCSTVNHVETVSSEVKKETLTFRITWKAYSGRGEAIQKIVNSYNAVNNDNFEIKMVDGDEDFNTVKGILEKDSPVDIYVLPYRFVKYFGYEDKLVDLTNDFNKEKEFFIKTCGILDQLGKKLMEFLGLGILYV